MSENLPVKFEVPTLLKEIEIKPEWLTVKADILTKTATIVAISNQTDFNEAEIVLKMITSHSNALEKHRKDLARPFQAVDKKIKELADNARESLEIEKEKLKKKMTAYLDAENKKRQEEIETKAEIIQSNPFAQYTQSEELKIETAPVIKLASASTFVWKFEITDATQVPREFCSPDESKIRKYVQENKEAAVISGIRTWTESQIKSR